jgi:hypothetical protein
MGCLDLPKLNSRASLGQLLHTNFASFPQEENEREGIAVHYTVPPPPPPLPLSTWPPWFGLVRDNSEASQVEWTEPQQVRIPPVGKYGLRASIYCTNSTVFPATC